MSERPILFSGPMVRAILAGTKTQTRRAIKKWPAGGHVQPLRDGSWEWCRDGGFDNGVHTEKPRYGVPGDALWVKETFAAPWGDDYRFPGGEPGIFYRADHPEPLPDDGPWKPSIFMPRKLSRLTLVIDQVRVQRLQDISEEDARAEGCDMKPGTYTAEFKLHGYIAAYRDLWDRINGPGSWDASPWVWAITFRRDPG